MIRSFRDRATENLWLGQSVRKFDAIAKQALRRLDTLNAARDLRDLAMAPGNNLEALKGDRKGQHSIRINLQWRICFVWTVEGPSQVEIVDSHK